MATVSQNAVTKPITTTATLTTTKFREITSRDNLSFHRAQQVELSHCSYSDCSGNSDRPTRLDTLCPNGGHQLIEEQQKFRLLVLELAAAAGTVAVVAVECLLLVALERWLLLGLVRHTLNVLCLDPFTLPGRDQRIHMRGSYQGGERVETKRIRRGRESIEPLVKWIRAAVRSPACCSQAAVAAAKRRG